MVESCNEGLYGTSWSRTGESDTLWRAYSRVEKDENTKKNLSSDQEGVQVSTTLGKLEKAFRESDAPPATRLFIGTVMYQSPTEIEQWMANQANTFGPKAFAKPEEMVALLLRKRNAFAHESEVRCFIADPQDDAAKSLFTFSFDANELFDTIAFDPRLSAGEYNERVAAAKELGFNGKVLEHDLYLPRIYEIPLNNKFRPIEEPRDQNNQ